MSRRFSIYETAEIEINEAADFYDLESPGLGSAFVDEVQRAIESISQFPDAAPLLRGCVRKKLLFKFPYSLVYSVRPEPGHQAVASFSILSPIPSMSGRGRFL